MGWSSGFWVCCFVGGLGGAVFLCFFWAGGYLGLVSFFG